MRYLVLVIMVCAGLAVQAQTTPAAKNKPPCESFGDGSKICHSVGLKGWDLTLGTLTCWASKERKWSCQDLEGYNVEWPELGVQPDGGYVESCGAMMMGPLLMEMPNEAAQAASLLAEIQYSQQIVIQRGFLSVKARNNPQVMTPKMITPTTYIQSGGMGGIVAPSVPAGYVECYRDSGTGHFTCISAKGSVLDVEDALDKLDKQAAAGTDGNAQSKDNPLLPEVQQWWGDATPQRWGDLRSELAEVAQTVADGTELACVCSEFENDEANGKFVNGSSPNCGKPEKGKEYIATCWDTKAKNYGDSGNGGGKPGYACIPGDERKECPNIITESSLDVPAVMHNKNESKCTGYELWPSGVPDKYIEDFCTKVVKYYTCDDKSRVLLPPDGHGKHWCHKVQP
jgi:hypothetical protein